MFQLGVKRHLGMFLQDAEDAAAEEAELQEMLGIVVGG